MDRSEALDPATAELLRSSLPTLLPGAVGAYLHGSAGLGRLRPQSDVDVVVVVSDPLTAGERAQLTAFLLATSGPYPRPADGPRPIELTVVVHADIEPWRHPPRCEYLYGEWLRAGIEAGDTPGPFGSPDLAVVLAMVLECDAPLVGPPPATLFGPVPIDDIARGGRDGIPDLVANLDGDTTNVLLTLARIWFTASTGRVTTKDAAGDWAVGRTTGDVAEVLARARAAYVDGTPHEWGVVGDDVRSVAASLVAAIDEV